MTKKAIKSPEQKPVVIPPKHPCQIDRCGKESSHVKVTSTAGSDPLYMCPSHYANWERLNRPYFIMLCPACSITIVM